MSKYCQALVVLSLLGLSGCSQIKQENSVEKAALPKPVSQDQVSNSKPNVIVFLVDDLGVNDTSLAMSQSKTLYNKRYKTPNLEKMAEQGITLTNARANAICVPSRVSLLTGQSFIRHQVKGDIVATMSKSGALLFPPAKVIEKPEDMLPALLQKQGYLTVHAGKYHVCHHCSSETSPTPEMAGFDINIGGSFYGAPGSYQPVDEYGNVKQPGRLKGLENYYSLENKQKNIHLTDALTEEAMSAVKPAVNKQQPFFLYLAHYAVHTPIQPHNKYLKNYKLTVGEPEQEGQYASMIEGVDASLGYVMAKLEQWQVAENTLVIFYSDNGGRVLGRGKKSLYGDWQFNFPLRSGKASNYEGGNRVPGVVKWPAGITANITNTAPVMIEDIYSTVLSVAGVNVEQRDDIDGMDWSKFFSSKQVPEIFTNRSQFFAMPYQFEGTFYNGADFIEGGVEPATSVISDKWKLIYFFTDERFELYNLADDRAEQVNLINQQPVQAQSLVALLDSKMKQHNFDDIMPKRSSDGSAINWPNEAFKEFSKSKG